MNQDFEISIILPCLNEEKSIGKCIESVIKVINKFSLDAEVIVVNNGSTDNSENIIKSYIGKIPNLKIIDEKIKEI